MSTRRSAAPQRQQLSGTSQASPMSPPWRVRSKGPPTTPSPPRVVLRGRQRQPARTTGSSCSPIQESSGTVGSAEEVLNDERQRTVAAVSSGRQVVQQPAAHALNAPSLQSWLNRLGTGRNDPLQSAQLRRLGPLSTLTRAEDPVRPAARAPACAGQASDRKVYRGSGTARRELLARTTMERCERLTSDDMHIICDE